jgi:polysaccharide deacetylase family protein (PEP-CTERM system associated)
MENIFTVDTEDWSQLMCSYLGYNVPVSEQFASSTRSALDLLDSYEARATFFVVGPHATACPEVLREIADRGHEVAAHGWTHMKLSGFTPGGFKEDIRMGLERLEDIVGQRVRGYRAPFFSLMPEQRWAFQTLADADLEYDSSLTSLLWQQESIPLPDGPFVCELPDGRELLEIPAPARKIGPITGRLIGGRTLRVLPKALWREHMDQCQVRDQPAMIYVHSYEVTPDDLVRYIPPVVTILDRVKLFASAKAFELGVGRMERALHELLGNHSWTTMANAAARLRERDDLPRLKMDSEGEVEVVPAGKSPVAAGGPPG